MTAPLDRVQQFLSEIDSIRSASANMAQQPPRHHLLLDTLRAAIDQGSKAPSYLVDQARELGQMHMSQSHIDRLREEFSLPEEIEALARYLSDDNYAAYMGTKPFEVIDLTMEDEDQSPDRPLCCPLQPQGLHVHSCPNYRWDNVDQDALWGEQAAAGGSRKSGRDDKDQNSKMEWFEPSVFDLPASRGPVNGIDAASSGSLKEEEGGSSKMAAARGRPDASNASDDEAAESISEGVICCSLQSQGQHHVTCSNFDWGAVRYVGLGQVGTTASGTPMEGIEDEAPQLVSVVKADPYCCNRTSSAPHDPNCVNRRQSIPLWKKSTRTTLIPKFQHFIKLPQELRTTIYELALSSDATIAPQLCDEQPDGRVQFHDANQHSRQKPNHIAIALLLGVTRVSKQIREESLPCFYSANTFSITPDTPTYFGYLGYLGRLNMIRRVQLNIPKLNPVFAPQILAQMKTYMSDVKSYEKTHPLPAPIGSAERKGKTRAAAKLAATGPYDYFVNHPRYITGGLDDVGMLIVVGMLSSSTPPSSSLLPPTPAPPLASSSSAHGSKSSSSPSPSHFILPAPTSDMFTSTYPNLAWFASVLRGMDITLHLVPNRPLRFHALGSVGILWQQKFQKSEFDARMSEQNGGKQLDKRVREMWPELGEGKGKFWDKTSYLRSSCDGMRHFWWEARF